MSIDEEIYDAIKASGIDLILSVPCAMLGGLLNIINEKDAIEHIPVTREEEGVGIAAGAYLGGKTPAILMQNSGLGNSINAIRSLLGFYRIPVVFIMSHRGAEGEKIAAQIPMGEITTRLLDCVGVETAIIDSRKKLKGITSIVEHSKVSSSSVAVVLKRPLWEDGCEKI